MEELVRDFRLSAFWLAATPVPSRFVIIDDIASLKNLIECTWLGRNEFLAAWAVVWFTLVESRRALGLSKRAERF